MRKILPACCIVAVAMALAALIFYVSPLIANGQVAGCPAGTVRQATTGDVAQFKILDGSAETAITVGTCLTQSDISRLGISGGAAQAIQDLSQNFICPGYQAGYNSSVSATTLKNNYVYFSANGSAIDPKFIVCVDTFLKAAKAKGYNPCLTAALRTPLAQQASCQDPTNTIVCGLSSKCNLQTITNTCPHVKGIAVDAKPQPTNAANYAAMHALAAQYGLGYPVAGDLPHIQPVSANCMGGTTSPGPQTTPPTTTPPSTTPPTTTPGTGSPATATPGQVLGQDTYCMISTNPVITVPVPAGTPFPSNCYNGGAGSVPTQTQAYCSGNTVIYQNSGVVVGGQACPAACQNGMCVQTQQCVSNGSSLVLTSSCQMTQCPTGYILNNGLCMQQQCPAGYTSSNGMCNQTQCPQGYTLVNGLCNQTPQSAQQQAQQQQTQPTGTQSPTASPSPASTVTNPGTTQTVPAPTNTVSPTSITSPTLIPNLGTSTIAQIEAFANPQNTVTTSAATETPITLEGAAQDITQLQPTSSPNVTYAQPTSALFNNPNGNGTAGQQPGNGASANGITTTAGSGYGITAQSAANTGPAYATGTIAQTQGSDTFVSNNTPAGTVPAASFYGQSTFSSALAILGVLKNEVLSALQYLSTYTKPFGGVVPSQQGGD